MNSMGGLAGTPPVPAAGGSMFPAALNAEPMDAEEELQEARDSYNSLKQQNSDLQDCYGTNVTSVKRNRTMQQITRAVALAGLGTFITAAIMSTMVPYIAGAAVGSVAYVASGFFKGRTRFFNDRLTQTSTEISQSRTQMEKAEKRLKTAQHVVDRSRKDINDYQRSLERSASQSSVIEDDDVLSIEGVSLRKHRPHLKSIVSDLFGKLER